MDTIVKDRLGNEVRVGDTVATAMVCRHAGNVRVGTVEKDNGSALKLRMLDTKAVVWRNVNEVVKAATP